MTALLIAYIKNVRKSIQCSQQGIDFIVAINGVLEAYIAHECTPNANHIRNIVGIISYVADTHKIFKIDWDSLHFPNASYAPIVFKWNPNRQTTHIIVHIFQTIQLIYVITYFIHFIFSLVAAFRHTFRCSFSSCVFFFTSTWKLFNRYKECTVMYHK